MIIDETNYVCPKCRRVFHNYDLRSYNSHMAEAAKDFLDSNDYIEVCPDCHLKLVQEEYVKYFNMKGEFCLPTQYVSLPLDTKEYFTKFNNFISELHPLFGLLDLKSVKLDGIIEAQKKQKEELAVANKMIINDYDVVSKIVLTMSTKEKSYVLYEITLDIIELANIGGRYNSFYIEYLIRQNTLALEFFKELIETDCKVSLKTSQKVKFEKELQSYRKTNTLKR